MTCRMYSLGHSTQPLDALVERCRRTGIELLCDIRRFPRSRRHPQFAREHLERELTSRSLQYAWLGDTLGGFRDGGYERWMQSADFERGLTELERLAAERTLGFMCAEGSPSRCHRRPDAPSAPPPAWAERLASRGHRIDHLLLDGTTLSVPTPLGLGDQ